MITPRSLLRAGHVARARADVRADPEFELSTEPSTEPARPGFAEVATELG